MLGIISLAAAASPAMAQQNRLRIEWTDYALQYRDQTDRRLTFVCPAGGQLGKVQGTDVYTDGSSVCSAAVHAGLIDAENGGRVTIVIVKGMDFYEGSTRNGVSSGKFGVFGGSFRFDPQNKPGQIDWSTSAVGLSVVEKPLTLVCPPEGSAGRIWGTGFYSEDSGICTAAVHAGQITFKAGGPVTIENTGPQESFTASERNGVTSIGWKSWPTSFSVSLASVEPEPVNSAPPQPAAPQPAAPNPASDVAGVTVSPASGLVTTEAGGLATFTVRLNSQPVANVVIPLMSSRTAEGTVSPGSLTFTPSNWMTAQTVTVRGVNDPIDDGDQPYLIRTGIAQAVGDNGYNNYDAADVSVTNNNDDAANIVVSPTSGLVTTEGGGTATFTIVLASQPIGSVVISVSSSNTGEGTVSPASISFGPGNWSSPQTITVRGVDDTVADRNIYYSIITSNAMSTDPKYNNLVVADVGVVNRDDERVSEVTPTPPVDAPIRLATVRAQRSVANGGFRTATEIVQTGFRYLPLSRDLELMFSPLIDADSIALSGSRYRSMH